LGEGEGTKRWRISFWLAAGDGNEWAQFSCKENVAGRGQLDLPRSFSQAGVCTHTPMTLTVELIASTYACVYMQSHHHPTSGSQRQGASLYFRIPKTELGMVEIGGSQFKASLGKKLVRLHLNK
jgi:hypothetical protein